MIILDDIVKKIIILEKEIELLKKENQLLNDKINKLNRGSNCSISGNTYEQGIHNILKDTFYDNKPFHTQNINELGGSSSSNDIVCINNIGIEVKKAKTPDWMQCSLKLVNNKWEGSEKGKIPFESRQEFNKIIGNTKLFNNNIPPFMTKQITHKEWLEIKSKNTIFDDSYIKIPDDTINKLYLAKGCYYIQISDYGLYRLGDDIFNFNVPLFKIPQKLRIRTKIHTRKNKDGFCVMSVIASCLPDDISLLKPSMYSLDSVEKLPKQLIHKKEIIC